jgi:hypothetical protein
MNQPFDRAGIEPAIADMLSDPVVRLVMRRDGLSDDDLWRAVQCGRTRLAAPAGTVHLLADRPCCRGALSSGPIARLQCA